MTPLSQPKWQRLELCLYALAALTIMLLILFRSPASFIHDEASFYSNLELMSEIGLTKDFLLTMREQSPGPLYQIVHAALRPITGPQVRSVRLVNAACLIGAILLVAGLVQDRGRERRLVIAGSMLAIPGSWVIGGMALTEAPAMLCVCGGIALLLRTLRRPSTLPVDAAWSAVAGFLLSLAIIGRQPYLILIPAVWILTRRADRQRLFLLLLFTLAASVVPVMIFATWGGLVPSPVASRHSEWNPYFAMLGFGYAGLFTLILAPKWFQLNRSLDFACLAALTLGLGANLWKPTLSYLPMASVARSCLGQSLADGLSLVFPVLLPVFGFYFLASALRHLRSQGGDRESMFLTLTTLAIVATCAKSSAQFSSRYVVQAAPFLVAMTSGFAIAGMTRLARILLGGALGISSLLSYYR